MGQGCPPHEIEGTGVQFLTQSRCSTKSASFSISSSQSHSLQPGNLLVAAEGKGLASPKLGPSRFIRSCWSLVLWLGILAPPGIFPSSPERPWFSSTLPVDPLLHITCIPSPQITSLLYNEGLSVFLGVLSFN